jgi:hypothetical protein
MAEEHSKDKSHVSEKTEKKDNTDKRMLIYAFVIIGIIVVLLGIVIVNQMSNSVSYAGLDFKKTLQNNVEVYATTVVIKTQANGQNLIKNMTFYFRNNPKGIRLDKSDEEDIHLLWRNLIYVSLAEPLPKCTDTFESLYDFSAFLTIYGVQVKGALSNESFVKDGFPLINCQNSTNNTVIMIGAGNYTGYEKIQPNCYQITYRDCEISKATEGFSLRLLKQAFGKD